jgi:hypothetical protein
LLSLFCSPVKITRTFGRLRIHLDSVLDRSLVKFA